MTTAERWQSYYRQNRDALMKRYPTWSKAGLRLDMERNYGKSEHLNKVLSEVDA